VRNEQWPVAISHIQSLADGDAADQIFHQDHHGFTATTIACDYDAPLELVQVMIVKAKLDSRKRCLLAITCIDGMTALHHAASLDSDPAVFDLLIREHPLALSATDGGHGDIPLQFATNNDNPAIISLLTEATNDLAARDYAALAALVHSSTFALRWLAEPSYAASIAVRTSLFLCLKTVHPDVPFVPTEPRDLRLAHASVQGRLERHPRVRVEAERRSK